MKLQIILIICLLSSNKLFAQTDTTKSFLSKTYFPFDFGLTFSNQTIIKTGIEYRINTDRGVFFRFNVDNRSNKFSIIENPITNVINGTVKFEDYVLGVGYRLGKSKLKSFVLCQGGISSYEFPLISGTQNNLVVDYQQSETPIIKTTIGFEYYIAKNAALTIESCHLLHVNRSVFWTNQLSAFSISFGLTATLF